MCFINDENFIFSLYRCVAYLFYDTADIVHAVVGGCINLSDIHKIACIDRTAVLTFITGALFGRMQAVDCFGKDLSRRCLSCPPGPGKQIRMPDPVLQDLIAKSLYHMFLPFDLIKSLRSEFSVKGNV